jgi:hypothetical protein
MSPFTDGRASPLLETPLVELVDAVLSVSKQTR